MRNHRLIPIIAILSLTACSTGDTGVRAMNAVEDNASATWQKTRSLVGLERKTSKPAEHTQPRYCYRAFEDITCYSRPIAGQENRLVAYQGSTGQTGYVLPGAKTSNTVLPPLKSVTVNSPPKIASDMAGKKDGKQLKEIIFDPAELQPKELVPQKTE